MQKWEIAKLSTGKRASQEETKPFAVHDFFGSLMFSLIRIVFSYVRGTISRGKLQA